MIGFFAVGYATAILAAFGAAGPTLLAIAGVFQRHSLALVPAYLLRKKSWSWMLHPGLAILTARDVIMAEGIARMFKDHPDADAAVVVVGRAHLGGLERELIEKHGFAPAEL
jgi:hypothetical protein